MFVVIGFGAMFLPAAIDYRRWREWWVAVYGIGMFSLVGVMAFGVRNPRERVHKTDGLVIAFEAKFAMQ